MSKHPALSKLLRYLPTDRVVVLEPWLVGHIQHWAEQGSEEAQQHLDRIGEGNVYTPEGVP